MNREVKIMNHLHTVTTNNMNETHEGNTKQKKEVTEDVFNLHTVKDSIYIE